MKQPLLDKDISQTGLQQVSDWYYANIRTKDMAEFKELEEDQLDTVCQLFMADYELKSGTL